MRVGIPVGERRRGERKLHRPGLPRLERDAAVAPQVLVRPLHRGAEVPDIELHDFVSRAPAAVRHLYAHCDRAVAREPAGAGVQILVPERRVAQAVAERIERAAPEEAVRPPRHAVILELPPFEDYRMAGRTYRFFRGSPLYPFGHGLSYTTFRYKNLHTSVRRLPGDGTIAVSMEVTNTGRRAGDEVVQLYVRHLGSAVERPNKDLRGYRRVTLEPGETRTVEFPLAASSLAYWNPDAHRWVVEDEPVRIEVGASSADIRLAKKVRVAARR